MKLIYLKSALRCDSFDITISIQITIWYYFDIGIKKNKLPGEVNNPSRRKKLLDSLSGHDSMTSVQAILEKLDINLDKTVSKDLCNALPKILENATAKATPC